jgi:hypothetical protein
MINKIPLIIIISLLYINISNSQTCTYSSTIGSGSTVNLSALTGWTGCTTSCLQAMTTSGATVGCSLYFSSGSNKGTIVFDKSLLINGNVTILGSSSGFTENIGNVGAPANITVNGNFLLPNNNQDFVVNSGSSILITNGTLAITGNGAPNVGGSGTIIAGSGGLIALGKATCNTTPCPVVSGTCTGSGGACTAPTTCTSIPTFTSTTQGSRCGTGTVTLNAIPNTGVVYWYTTSTGGSNSGSGNSFTTPSISSNTTYYAQIDNCSNFTRAAITASVAGSAVSGTPTITSSSTTVCQNGSLNFTVTGLLSSTSYNWTLPSGFSITSGAGTSIIGVSISSSAISGNISVSGANACSNGIVSTQAITVNPSVPTPGAITGSTTVCQSQIGIIYSITTVAGNTYSWNMPVGFVTTSGANTNTVIISITGAAASGTISVSGTNSCGTSAATTQAITVNPSISNNTLSSSMIICYNTSPSTLTGLTPIGGNSSFIYSWESSNTSSVSGFSVASGTNNSINYNPGSLTGTTWYRRVVNSSTCSNSISNVIQITVTTLIGSWLGNASDWNNPVNWCGGILPIITSDVSINSGSAFMPIITSSGAFVKSLFINSGGSLSLSGTNILSVSGDFMNSGSFIASSSSMILFSGSSIQSITGTNTFANLTLAKTTTLSGVKLGGNLNLTGTLDLGSNGLLNTLGYTFVLISNSITGTARIEKVISNSTIVGNITVQRYIPAKLSFRFLSSPVTGITFYEWKKTMLITGNGSGSDPNSSLPTVYQYNEPLAGNQDIGFQNINGVGNSIQAGKGYKVFVRGDRSINVLSNYGATPTLLSVTGVPNIGQISLPVTYTSTTGGNVSTDGWNLVGNPFPSQIDWKLITAGGANFQNIDNAIYILDPVSSNNTTAGSYLSYVGGVAAGPGALNPNPNYISSSQAFFVHANGPNPILRVDESSKVSGTPNDHFKTEEIPSLLRVLLDGVSGQDNTAIRFVDNASNSFDSRFDAYKIANSNAGISSLDFASTDLSINSLPVLTNTQKNIPLKIATAVNGSHRLSFINLGSFASNIKISLLDKHLNTTTDINEGDTYSFVTSTVSGTKGNGRFEIIFTPQFGSVMVKVSPDSLVAADTTLKWSINGEWYGANQTVTNISTGAYIVTFANVNGWHTPATQQLTVTSSNLSTAMGVYLPKPKVGSVLVLLTPGSIDNGRIKTQWRINNGTWQFNNVQLDSLPIGNYTLSFVNISGWIKHQDLAITIENNKVTTISADYLPINEATIKDTLGLSTSNLNSLSNSGTKSLSVNLYPNPLEGNNNLMITAEGLSGENLNLSVIDIKGINVFSKTIDRMGNIGFMVELNVFKGLPQGLYFIKITQGEKIIVKKLIKD